ncbi:MAG: hypothetical protein ABII82_21075 [Verrucomicrobiota bacterium]
MDLLQFALGLGLSLGLGVVAEGGVLGLLEGGLVFLDEGIAFAVELLDLLTGLLFVALELGVLFLGLVVAVEELGHVDHEDLGRGLGDGGEGGGAKESGGGQGE